VNRTQKRLLRTLRLLAFAPFVAGFITGMVVFREPEGMMLVGLGGMVGIWMIAATAAYLALKHYLLPPER
jgi:chemotaxis receptor (MCP) glutamine deamidase CheD